MDGLKAAVDKALVELAARAYVTDFSGQIDRIGRMAGEKIRLPYGDYVSLRSRYAEKFAKYLLTYLPDEVLRKGYEVARHRQESPAVFDEKHKFKLIPPDTVNFS